MYGGRGIALVGLPGSGKSTIGRQLARRLKLPFADTDDVIEQRLGCSIREYFEREGEERFRDLEEEVLQEMANSHRGVLATGGGIVLRPGNIERLRGAFTVVYLRSRPEDLSRRLRHDANRPLLQVADPLERLRLLHSTRDPLYLDASSIVIESGGEPISALVGGLMMQLRDAGARGSDTGTP